MQAEKTTQLPSAPTLLSVKSTNQTHLLAKHLNKLHKVFSMLPGDGRQLPLSSAPHLLPSLLALARGICPGRPQATFRSAGLLNRLFQLFSPNVATAPGMVFHCFEGAWCAYLTSQEGVTNPTWQAGTVSWHHPNTCMLPQETHSSPWAQEGLSQRFPKGAGCLHSHFLREVRVI